MLARSVGKADDRNAPFSIIPHINPVPDPLKNFYCDPENSTPSARIGFQSSQKKSNLPKITGKGNFLHTAGLYRNLI